MGWGGGQRKCVIVFLLKNQLLASRPYLLVVSFVLVARVPHRKIPRKNFKEVICVCIDVFNHRSRVFHTCKFLAIQENLKIREEGRDNLTRRTSSSDHCYNSHLLDLFCVPP